MTENVISDDTATDIGDAIVAYVTADRDLPVTAVNVAGVVTFTVIDGLRFWHHKKED